jgi:hypothetical protein
MTNTDMLVALGGMVAIAIAALLINDGVHYHLAHLHYRQYRNSLDEMTRCIDALAAQNGAQLAELDRLRKASDLSEFEDVARAIDLEARR